MEKHNLLEAIQVEKATQEIARKYNMNSMYEDSRRNIQTLLEEYRDIVRREAYGTEESTERAGEPRD